MRVGQIVLNTKNPLDTLSEVEVARLPLKSKPYFKKVNFSNHSYFSQTLI